LVVGWRSNKGHTTGMDGCGGGGGAGITGDNSEIIYTA
jgi:hypothetical protein